MNVDAIAGKPAPTFTPQSWRCRAVEQQGFVQDPAQWQEVQVLQRSHEALHSGARSVKGVYLWGPVGRGKTWLMDQFYQSLRVPARRQHFHHFMQWVHQRLFQLTGVADPLKIIAKDLGKELKVLCFDELFVNDIGDAIILGRLFQVMFDEGVVLVCTSNLPPEQLYSHGHNKERFAPAITAILKHMDVVSVDGAEDHRLHPGIAQQRYWVKAADQPSVIGQVFTELTQGKETSDAPIAVGHRSPTKSRQRGWMMLSLNSMMCLSRKAHRCLCARCWRCDLRLNPRLNCNVSRMFFTLN